MLRNIFSGVFEVYFNITIKLSSLTKIARFVFISMYFDCQKLHFTFVKSCKTANVIYSIQICSGA